MRKLVLAIIAVGVLQIAFLLNTATSLWTVAPSVSSIPIYSSEIARDLGRAMQPSEVDQSANAVAPKTDTDTRSESAVRRPHRDFDFRPDAPNRSRSTRNNPRANPLEISPRPQEEKKWSRVMSSTPIGSTILIEYRAPQPVSRMKEVSAVAQRVEDPRPRKRSLIAKVFTPLVKKPWNFMKSVASKFN